MKETKSYYVKWVSLRDANAFVVEHHRHNLERQGHIFSLGLYRNRELVGVAICGRPSAAAFDTGDNMEVYRCCLIDDVDNGCSILYSACARIATEMGCNSINTYTLESESGASLIATGWICVDDSCGGNGKKTGNRKGRAKDTVISLFPDARKKISEEEPKKRWVKLLFPKVKKVKPAQMPDVGGQGKQSQKINTNLDAA
jgi:hypothetical protein